MRKTDRIMSITCTAVDPHACGKTPTRTSSGMDIRVQASSMMIPSSVHLRWLTQMTLPSITLWFGKRCFSAWFHDYAGPFTTRDGPKLDCNAYLIILIGPRRADLGRERQGWA